VGICWQMGSYFEALFDYLHIVRQPPSSVGVLSIRLLKLPAHDRPACPGNVHARDLNVGHQAGCSVSIRSCIDRFATPHRDTAGLRDLPPRNVSAPLLCRRIAPSRS
jgi:hypothetical protein